MEKLFPRMKRKKGRGVTMVGGPQNSLMGLEPPHVHVNLEDQISPSQGIDEPSRRALNFTSNILVDVLKGQLEGILADILPGIISVILKVSGSFRRERPSLRRLR